MSEQYSVPKKELLSVQEAIKILGTDAKGMTQHEISKLIVELESLTDVVVAVALDSKIQLRLDNSKHK